MALPSYKVTTDWSDRENAEFFNKLLDWSDAVNEWRLYPSRARSLRVALEVSDRLRGFKYRGALWEACNTKEGYIYIIQGEATRHVKVGFAMNVEVRLKDIQACSPDQLSVIGTIKGSMYLERQLHNEFSEQRLHYEWFSEDILIGLEGRFEAWA